MSNKIETKTTNKKVKIPNILKKRISKLDLTKEQIKLVKDTTVQMILDGTLTSRNLYYKKGIDITLKKALGVKVANSIIKQRDSFKLSKGLMKRLDKYTKTQQTRIINLCQIKIESKEIKKADLWYGKLTEIIKEVIDRNTK